MDSSGPEAEWNTLPLPVGVRAPRTIRGSAGELSGERRGLITPVVGLLYGLESRTFPFVLFQGRGIARPTEEPRRGGLGSAEQGSSAEPRLAPLTLLLLR